MSASIKIPILGDATSFAKAVHKAQGEADGLGGKLTKLATSGPLAFAAIGTAAAGFAMKSANTFSNIGKEVAKIQRFTGLTAENASRLRFAAKMTGIDVDKLTKSLGIMSKNLVAGKLDGLAGSMKGAGKATKAIVEANEKHIEAVRELNDLRAVQSGKTKRTIADNLALAKAEEKVWKTQTKVNELFGKGLPKVEGLGFAVRDATGKLLPMHDVLINVAEKIKSMPAGAEKTALAMKVFGKSGADLIPILNKGAAGIAELEAQSDKFGNTLSGADLEAVKESTRQHRLFSAAMDGIQIAIGRYVLPAITSFVTYLTDHMPQIIKFVNDRLHELGAWFREHGPAALETAKGAFEKVRSWLAETFIPMIGTVGEKIEELWARFQNGRERIQPFLSAMMDVFKSTLDGLVTIINGFIAVYNALPILGDIPPIANPFDGSKPGKGPDSSYGIVYDSLGNPVPMTTGDKGSYAPGVRPVGYDDYGRPIPGGPAPIAGPGSIPSVDGFGPNPYGRTAAPVVQHIQVSGTPDPGTVAVWKMHARSAAADLYRERGMALAGS